MKLAVLAALLTAVIAYGQDISTRSLGLQDANGRTDDRILSFEKLLASSPDNLTLQSGLISAYLQKLRESGDGSYLDRASKLVNRMMAKEGGNSAALRFLNEIDMQRHDFKAVAERARDIAKFEPSDAANWGNLGDALMELGEYDAAGQAYTKMIALRPSLASYNRLAYMRFVTGDSQAAIQLMSEAVESGSPVPENTAWCWAELGDMYFKLGKLGAAKAAYTSALQLFPRLHRALAGMGRLQASEGRLEDAIHSYEQAQSIVPMVEYSGALEDLYGAAGMKSKARQQQDLTDAIDQLGRAAREKTNRTLALILADHGRSLPRALALMEAEIPVRGDVYTWDAFSWVLFKNGRVAEARAASLKAVKLGTPEPGFYYHASKIASAAGAEEAARQYSDRLRLLNPKFDFAKTRGVADSIARRTP